MARKGLIICTRTPTWAWSTNNSRHVHRKKTRQSYRIENSVRGKCIHLPLTMREPRGSMLLLVKEKPALSGAIRLIQQSAPNNTRKMLSFALG